MPSSIFSTTSATMPSRSCSLSPTLMARRSIIWLVSSAACRASKEHRQILGKQNTLLEDDFALCDFPSRLGGADRIVPLADEGVGLVFDAVLIDQEAAGHVDLCRLFQIRPHRLDLNVA